MTTWAKEMNFVMSHAPTAGSIAWPDGSRIRSSITSIFIHFDLLAIWDWVYHWIYVSTLGFLAAFYSFHAASDYFLVRHYKNDHLELPGLFQFTRVCVFSDVSFRSFISSHNQFHDSVCSTWHARNRNQCISTSNLSLSLSLWPSISLDFSL